MPALQKVNVEREKLRAIAQTQATQMAQLRNSVDALALTKATIERKAQKQGQSAAEYLGQTSPQEIAKNIEKYAESAADIDQIAELTIVRQKTLGSRKNANLDLGRLMQLKRQQEFKNKSTAQLVAYVLAQENPETAKVAGLALRDDLLKKPEEKNETQTEPEKILFDPQVQIRNNGSLLKISLVSAAELAAPKNANLERLANLRIKPIQDPLISAEFVAEKLKIRQRA
ncbi:MAG: hypothetical protein LBJ25_03710 [Candidatus Margulisbacteria bacterium]|jgi:hypothetical protein|nr:hypothetical protein [Candidatus Margulisiibacteriota bacterium]